MKNQTEWRDFFCLIPRKIEGRWVWIKWAQVRTIYPHGAMGILIGSERHEYRLTPPHG